MLLEIKIEKTDIIPRNTVNDSHFFSEMARVSEAGYHRIAIKRGLAKLIVKKFDLSNRHKERIKSIGQDYYKNYSFLNTPLELNVPRLSVVYGDGALLKTGKISWQIGHNTLIEKEFHEKTVLLAEDENDCEFYKTLLHTEAKRIKFGSIEFDEVPGGGTNTSKSFEKNAVGKSNIVVCICDSDRLVPNEEFRNPYKSVLEKSKELNFIGRVDCTPGREIENFIPAQIIHNVTKYKNQKYTDNLIELILSQGTVSQLDCVGLFYDMKGGCSETKLNSENFNEAQKAWIERKYGNFFKQDPTKVLPVYGKAILRDFLKKMTTKNENEFVDEYKNFLDSDYWELHYSEWVLKLLWFFCGDDKKIIVKE